MLIIIANTFYSVPVFVFQDKRKKGEKSRMFPALSSSFLSILLQANLTYSSVSSDNQVIPTSCS